MKKMTKGALAMVLAGAVTFSVANALLAEKPLKRLAKEIAFPISADREKAIVVNQPEKKDPKPTTNVKDHDIVATQVALKNSHPATIAVQENTKKLSTTNKAPAVTPVATTVSVKSTKAPTTSTKLRTATPSTVTKPRTNTTSASTKPVTATKPVTSTKPATTTKPVTSTKPATTTKPVTSTKPVTTTKPVTSAKPKTATTTATTKTNRGQQVSQAAKEEAASRKDN